MRSGFLIRKRKEDNMKTGKISETILKRSVLKRISKRRPEIISCPAVGMDYSAVKIAEDEVFVISVDSFTEMDKDYIRANIVAAVNNIATSGAEALGVMIAAFLPSQLDEPEFRLFVDQAEETCKELNIQAMGGHTQITDAVNKPIIAVTALGKVKEGKLLSIKKAKAGQDLVLTKWIGLEGSSILAKEKESIIEKKYKTELISKAKNYDQYLSIIPEAATAVKSGASALHDLAQGGIMAALWDIAEASGTGLKVDLRSIPVQQETIEICEIFDINPYRLISGGSLLIACDNGLDMVDALRAEGINAEIIGRLTDSNDKIIMNDGEVTYLDLPQPDEILKAL